MGLFFLSLTCMKKCSVHFKKNGNVTGGERRILETKDASQTGSYCSRGVQWRDTEGSAFTDQWNSQYSLFYIMFPANILLYLQIGLQLKKDMSGDNQEALSN